MMLKIEDLEYDIDEAKFTPGRSFFIPCLAPKRARYFVERALKAKRRRIFIKGVIEGGVSGLRVWRVC